MGENVKEAFYIYSSSLQLSRINQLDISYIVCFGAPKGYQKEVIGGQMPNGDENMSICGQVHFLYKS